MSDDSAGIAAPHYRAFISYSHADGRFAGWLHRKLEGARLPDKKRLSPIFFDRAELAAGPDLSTQVREALAQSAALVVIASPAARVSRWVGQEIALFRALHPDRPILAALIEGEPDQAFPDALLRSGDAEVEPLAADFRKGKDGKRLGLLKIVAGLTAQPLDRLVQRDAQTRQRRVMAVTAGAVLLSLILSAALVVAIRARAEAERQRGEAEGLVEFMLTDLRDKLKGVGRLDVMDSVNQRVLLRYANNENPGELPPNMLLRRARLLLAMGEDDLQSEGNRPRGRRAIDLAWQISGDVLSSEPDSEDAIWTHAQSEYWKGYARYVARPSGLKQNDGGWDKHWLQYLSLAKRLANKPSAPRRWRLEAVYAEGNLCALYATPPEELARAREHCRAASTRLSALVREEPTDIEAQLNLINAIGWEADVEAGLGNLEAALSLRSTQRRIADSIVERFPKDVRGLEAQLNANLGVAKMLTKAGRRLDAIQFLKAAERQSNALRLLDPSNKDWANRYRETIALRGN